MSAPVIEFRTSRSDAVSVLMRTESGLVIELEGELTDTDPKVSGGDALAQNRAVINNLWSYALFEKQRRRARNDLKRKELERSAKTHREVAENIAGLVHLAGSRERDGWCSSCFARTAHVKLTLPKGNLPGHLCLECGSPTLKCVAPRCDHMAVRSPGPVRLPRYCAEHRREIPSFERAAMKVSDLDSYAELLEFEKRNLAKVSQVGLVSVLTVGAGFVTFGAMAPAVGGAVGSLVGGYSGAAATNYGLALLGGGAIGSSSFALGMAGGTMVVSAVGAALGGGLGASVMLSYVSDDKSFDIEKLRDGDGTPVIVVNGFLTQGKDTWGGWRRMLDARYPDAPVYRVHWGSRELRGLAIAAGDLAGRSAFAATVKGLAARATKKGAAKLGPIAPAMVAADLAKNPWHTAKNRADRTGVALAGILARVDEPRFVLVGHSLGARAVLTAAEVLSTNAGAPNIEAVHVMGAAVGAKGEWRQLSQSVETSVFNYHSTRDGVLRYAYRAAQGGGNPAGLNGFKSPYAAIKDRNVSKKVDGHSAYFEHVNLA